MKRVLNLGKINLYGTGKRYPVEVTVELKRRGNDPVLERVNGKLTETGEFTPAFVEFTASAMVSARMGGQCLDEINKHRKDFTPENRDLWDDVYRYWKLYHLNGMHAGTPEQEKAIEDWMAQGNRYDYTAVCEMLKGLGMYEVPYTGKSTGRYYNNEPYKYGHGWLVQEIPGDDLIRIEHLLNVG